MAKMLLSILWHTRAESPELITHVEESLNTLERLASVCILSWGVDSRHSWPFLVDTTH